MDDIIKSAQEEAYTKLSYLGKEGLDIEDVNTLITTTAHSFAEAVRKDLEKEERGLLRSKLLELRSACVDSNPATQKGWNMAILNLLSMYDAMEIPFSPTQEK